MSSAILSVHQHAEATAKKLHLCLLDDAGQVCAANYPLGDNRALPLPALIRLAYGVDAHPDMPETIYQRMESRIKTEAGSAGFYLCQNHDKTPFWISVNFYNTPTGRVVCHLPVSSENLGRFAGFFADLKATEDGGASATQAPLQDTNTVLGAQMQNYRALAVGIMAEELTKLDGGRDRSQFRKFVALNAILSALNDIDRFGRSIDAMSARSKLIPYQLKLQAARLEGGRGPFSVIASNHQELTNTLLAVTAELRSASSTDINALMDAMAYVSQATQAGELLATDQIAGWDGDTSVQSARAELKLVIADCSRQIDVLLANIDQSIMRLGRICQRMRRWLSAMETTRMMCKIERAQMSLDAEGLIDIEDQLQDVHLNLLKWMTKVEKRAADALFYAEGMKTIKTNKAA